MILIQSNYYVIESKSFCHSDTDGAAAGAAAALVFTTTFVVLAALAVAEAAALRAVLVVPEFIVGDARNSEAPFTIVCVFTRLV